MTLEEPSQKEVDGGIRYIRELRNDPPRFDRWVDRGGTGIASREREELMETFKEERNQFQIDLSARKNILLT